MDPMERFWGIVRDGPKPEQSPAAELYADPEGVRRFWERIGRIRLEGTDHIAEAEARFRLQQLGNAAVSSAPAEETEA